MIRSQGQSCDGAGRAFHAAFNGKRSKRAAAAGVGLEVAVGLVLASTAAAGAVWGRTSPMVSRGRVVPPPSAVCGSVRPGLRCPDLIMSAPSHLELDRTTIRGRVLLRATSSINNRGRGPLELHARRVGRHRWRVYQAVYGRNGHAHLFRTAATLVYKHVSGERYGIGNVGEASYWKLRHAAAFQLWTIDKHFRPLRLVRTGPKVDYCLRDLTRTKRLPRSPASPRYGACSQDFGLTSDTLGTSVGWSDVYPYEYPQQWIDVTGLRGRFAYVQEADPDHLLMESNVRNDVSETYVALPSDRVLGRRVGVQGP